MDMAEESTDSDRGRNHADHDRELAKKCLTGVHRPTVERADAHVARTLSQL
jgi:hypothetical protein